MFGKTKRFSLNADDTMWRRGWLVVLMSQVLWFRCWCTLQATLSLWSCGLPELAGCKSRGNLFLPLKVIDSSDSWIELVRISVEALAVIAVVIWWELKCSVSCTAFQVNAGRCLLFFVSSYSRFVSFDLLGEGGGRVRRNLHELSHVNAHVIGYCSFSIMSTMIQTLMFVCRMWSLERKVQFIPLLIESSSASLLRLSKLLLYPRELKLLAWLFLSSLLKVNFELGKVVNMGYHLTWSFDMKT